MMRLASRVLDETTMRLTKWCENVRKVLGSPSVRALQKGRGKEREMQSATSDLSSGRRLIASRELHNAGASVYLSINIFFTLTNEPAAMR